MQTEILKKESVSSLFRRYLIPAICGTMVTSIYVLADTIIIGKGIGIDAMAGLNIVLPLFNLFFGIGLLFGVGGSVLMSIARGKGNNEEGNRYFTTALLLNAITSIILTVILFLFMRPILYFLGATKVTMPYIENYAPYIIGGLCFFAFSTFLQSFVRNDGAPKLAMIAVISGGVLHIILDLIFVYPLDMGMKGAAIASVLGSVCTVLILVTHFLSKNNGLKLCFKNISYITVFNISKNGFSSFAVEIASGIVMFIYNIQILKYIGDIGVSMYGVITNTVIIVNCLCNGVNQAAQPIISVNYGAGFNDRVNDVKKIGLKTSFIICSAIAVIGLVVPDLFTYIFLNPNEEILKISKMAIRIYFLGFFAMGINVFIIGFFQSTIKPFLSLVICILRGCVLSILFVYLLPNILGVSGIWASMPLAEFITFIFVIIFLKKDKYLS